MTPNQITVLRVAMAFAAVALFGPHLAANVVALLLTVAAVFLDAVDGWVARRKKLSTPLGAQLDILGDRVIENLFFTFFAVVSLISVWVPVIFFVRGTLTDFVRSLAVRTGRTAFGQSAAGGVAAPSMLESRWARALVASRFSRAGYGILKCVCFCYLGAQLTLNAAANSGAAPAPALAQFATAWTVEILLGAQLLVMTTVAFCLVRGLPVLWEGRRYLGLLEPTAIPPLRSGHPRNLAA